jgi:NADH-quinone oxidoreductase subunit J
MALGALLAWSLNKAPGQSAGWPFGLFSALAVVFACAVIIQRRALYSALYVVLLILCVACLCLLLDAEFLAMALVIIYGGAILVTYVFVIMLAQQAGEAVYDRWARRPLAACLAGFLLLAALASIAHSDGASPAAWAARPFPGPSGDSGAVEQVGAVLMTRYVVAVEVAGVLLLLAMVGAVAIARKRFPADGARREPVVLGEVGRKALPF